MEITKVSVKKRAEFGKQCVFDTEGPHIDQEIKPNPDDMHDYIVRSHCHVGVLHSRQLALHEVQTVGTSTRSSGMFHFEGGWPKEINPRDEEATTRFRRRVEKDDDWAPKLRNLFGMMEHSVLQNGAVNIYEHYFDDMIPTALVQPLGLRTVNVYTDPSTPKRPVSAISWSPDSGSRIVVSYCFMEFGRLPDYSNSVYIWQVENPNKPYMMLEAFCPCVATEFNTRDPSMLVSGLMTGQVCSWDIRSGTTPVQLSDIKYSHRDCAKDIKWTPSKTNTEFFSASSDGCAMWWDTRNLRKPSESLMFDFENPNEPRIDRAVGVSCLNYGPMVGTKFMFGMENGIILTGSRRLKTNAEKLAHRFDAHYGPVFSVDRNVFNPSIFLSVGDWTARVWAEDIKEGNLVPIRFLMDQPTAGCWNKTRYSVFYVITASGALLTWDLLQDMQDPVVTIKLCKDALTCMAPCDEGTLMAIGNSVGKVFLVESMDYLETFERKDRIALHDYLERCAKVVRAVDTRIKEIKLLQATLKKAEEPEISAKQPKKSKRKSTRERRKSTKEPTKRKETQRMSVHSKERGGKGADKKERKEVKRVDFPDLALAEERYFQIVEMAKEKYSEEADPILNPARYSSMLLKKEEKEDTRNIQTQEETEFDAKAERRKSRRATRLRKLPRQSSEAALSKHSLRLSVPQYSLEAMDRKPLRRAFRKSLRKSEKEQRKGRANVAFRQPCKGEVCKPKVCCWRTDSKKLRTTRSRVRGRISLAERAESRQELGEMIKRASPSLSKLMDVPKPSAASRSRILKEMLAPPSELTEEVTRARREIRAARWLTGKARRRYIVQKILEDRDRRKAQKGQRKLKDEREESKDDWRTRRAARRKKKTVFDPCVPKKPKDFATEFEKLLGEPILKSIEDKPEVGKAYLEELAAARSRVYPRISEFHSIE